jgi:LL-H family phage holin
MEVLTTILNSPEFIALLLTVITAVIGFVGKTLRDFIGRKLTAEQLNLLIIIAKQAVSVAEQTGITKTGEEKKAEAIRVAQTYLDAYGIKVSVAQVEAAIEAAVFSELTKLEPAPDVLSDAAVDALASVEEDEPAPEPEPAN